MEVRGSIPRITNNKEDTEEQNKPKPRRREDSEVKPEIDGTEMGAGGNWKRAIQSTTSSKTEKEIENTGFHYRECDRDIMVDPAGIKKIIKGLHD